MIQNCFLRAVYWRSVGGTSFTTAMKMWRMTFLNREWISRRPSEVVLLVPADLAERFAVRRLSGVAGGAWAALHSLSGYIPVPVVQG